MSDYPERPKAVVLKFGGSDFTNSEGANSEQLYHLMNRLVDLLNTFAKIGLIIGGGPRIRSLQRSVEGNYEKDMIARKALWEHAETLSIVAKNFGYELPQVPHSLEHAMNLAEDPNTKVIALSWLKASQSTDASAMILAKKWLEQEYRTMTVILSNVPYIFTKDPKKNNLAKPIQAANIQNLIANGVLADSPENFTPGINVPIDPVAVAILRELAESGPDLFFGRSNFKNIRDFLKGKKPEKGTVISPKVKDTMYAC